jgi:putative FmdB family regulatory protein
VPIYDFRCRECGIVSEILLHQSGESACCPECGSRDMERLISASYIVMTERRAPGTTCCGRNERCDTPPCSTGDVCNRDQRR